MGKIHKLIITVLLVMLYGCASAPAPKKDDLAVFMGGFEGVWQGKFSHINYPEYPFSQIDKNAMELKVAVENASVEVSLLHKGAWYLIKSGHFKIDQHKTNAVIYSIDSADDVYDETGMGGWVETWSITLTHKDKNSLYATLTRVVNNYLKEPEYKKAIGEVVVQGRYIELYAGALVKNEGL